MLHSCYVQGFHGGMDVFASSFVYLEPLLNINLILFCFFLSALIEFYGDSMHCDARVTNL